MTMPLTFTGPAVALSRIAADLGGSPIALNWVTNAFMLTFGASLMAAGALADNHGRKRIFLAGLCLYVAGVTGLDAGARHRLVRCAAGPRKASAAPPPLPAAPRRLPRNSKDRCGCAPSVSSAPVSASASPSARSPPACSSTHSAGGRSFFWSRRSRLPPRRWACAPSRNRATRMRPASTGREPAPSRLRWLR